MSGTRSQTGQTVAMKQFVHRVQRVRDTELLLHLRQDLDRQQGMPAELEEVVLGPDLRYSQHLGP